MYDLIIIGSGPAGLSAAVYAKRSNLSVLVIEKEPICGGQINYTNEVDNYLGFSNINGMELALQFQKHVQLLDVAIQEGMVTSIQRLDTYYMIQMNGIRQIKSKAILLATGARHRMLHVAGEAELSGAGVSYCATCDGAFFENKNVAVIGGGNTAIEDALYLANICRHVYVIHRSDFFRANNTSIQRMWENSKIDVITDAVVEQICGEEHVTGIIIKEGKIQKQKKYDVNGVFIAVGMEPVGDYLPSTILRDQDGWVIANEDGRTNIEGIFVAGDLRKKPLRQVITAVSDGANAIYSVEQYLRDRNF